MDQHTNVILGKGVGAARQHICMIKRKELAVSTEIEAINRQIEESTQKLLKLEKERIVIRNGPLKSAIVLYSKASLFDLVTKMRNYLPRELRDIIYQYLLSSNMGRDAYLGKQEQLPKSHQDHVLGAHRHYLYEHRLHYLFDPKLVGQDTAWEVIAAYCSLVPGRGINPFIATSLSDIQHLVNGDIFHSGIDPATVLRQLTIHLRIDELEKGDFSRSAVMEGLTPLLRITNKSGFRMSIVLDQPRVQISLLEEFIQAARPILQVFEAEGANIDIRFRYSFDKKASLTLNEAYKNPDSDWKEAMTGHLKSLHRPLFDEQMGVGTPIFHFAF